MDSLKEKIILRKGLLFYFLPFGLIGVLSMFFPIVYALFPVQESEICVCSFFEMQRSGNKPFIIELSHQTFENLTMTNSISFYVINFIGLLVLVTLVYGIRHTDDDT
jgi:hypothetical protein